MLSTLAFGTLAAVACATPLRAPITPRQHYNPLVDSQSLQDDITSDALLASAQQLEDFAYATPERNRLTGGTAHNATVEYISSTLKSLNGSYTVELQPWTTLIPLSGSASFSADGVDQEATLMSYSPSGNVSAPVVAVPNQGCNVSDFPASVSGNIALVSRGTCTFGLKSKNAGDAGAAGIVIYNNINGSFNGTLSTDYYGDYVPSVGISLAAGDALVAALSNGTTVIGDLDVDSVIQNRTSLNVIAQTTSGNPNSTLTIGAHSDSVEAGPGINDDGSGSVALLEVAKQLSKYRLNNAVRFGWWAGEEEGLLGSTYYTDHLSPGELSKIKLYLNFDMIASPNYIYAAYDGDGDAFGTAGPPGSAEAEKLFEDYFASIGESLVPTAFDGRSDYAGFIDNNIPAGGLFTGAEQIKTEEEAQLFGGEAGVATDINYHGPGDNVSNLNMTAFLVNAKAIAHSVATYGLSFDSLSNSTNSTTRRSVPLRKGPVTLPSRKAKREAHMPGKRGKLLRQ